MPANSRSASWMCSGRTRMPFSLSSFRVLRIDRDRELLLVGRADDPIALDAVTEEQDRADRPVILAVALVVVRCPAHFTLDNDHKLLADLQFPGPADHVGDAGEELGDQLHLIGVVVGVAIELTDRQVGGDAYAGLERSQGDLRLLRQPLLRDRTSGRIV